MATPPKVSCIAIASLFTAFALCLLAGTFLKAWGQTGDAPGEFRALRPIAIDPRGRECVGERSNNRIPLFDHGGAFLAQGNEYGRPSGIFFNFFDAHDHIDGADSDSDDVQNHDKRIGIRVGECGDTSGNGAAFVSVVAARNIFGGQPAPRKMQR